MESRFGGKSAMAVMAAFVINFSVCHTGWVDEQELGKFFDGISNPKGINLVTKLINVHRITHSVVKTL